MRRRKDLAHRYKAVLTQQVAPTHLLEKALFDVHHQVGSHDGVTYALDIYLNDYEREIMQAWIVSGADDALINQILSIPVEVTQVYRYLFCDMGVFRDRLDLMSWVQGYRDAANTTAQGDTLLRTAVMQGPKALAWIYGRGMTEVDPAEVLKNAMSDAYFRGSNNRDHKVSSKEAQITHSYMETASKIAMVLDKKRPSDTAALALKLKHRDLTTPVTANAEEEVLH